MHDQRHLPAPQPLCSKGPQSPSPGANLNDKLIAERISTLLSHYWTASDPRELRALQIGDWLEDLSPFAAQFVVKACAEWRQTQTRRPTPADIRLLTIAAQREATPVKAQPRQITSQESEPIPAPDVVREHWRSIRFPLLTEAEKALFLDRVANRAEQARKAIAGAKMPEMPRCDDDLRSPAPARREPLPRFELAAEDDPAYLAELERLGL